MSPSDTRITVSLFPKIQHGEQKSFLCNSVESLNSQSRFTPLFIVYVICVLRPLECVQIEKQAKFKAMKHASLNR